MKGVVAIKITTRLVLALALTSVVRTIFLGETVVNDCVLPSTTQTDAVT